MTKELAEEMMSEVSSCISDQHDGKMDYQEVSRRRLGLDQAQGGRPPVDSDWNVSTHVWSFSWHA
jgi:hypothetical protein